MFEVDLETAEVWIYDELGPAWTGAIDAQMVRDALGELGGQDITLRLNSPGGAVDEGVAIFNLLRDYPGQIIVQIDSLAASMASYVAMAGNRIRMADNSLLMVHSPWTVVLGNSDQLRKEASLLDKYSGRMVPEYAKRSGKSAAEIEEIMRAETWYSSDEAVSSGFADEIVEQPAVAPYVSGLQRVAKRVPEALKKQRPWTEADRFPRRLRAKVAMNCLDAELG